MSTPSPINNRIAESAELPAVEHRAWWRDAAVYQIYIPSFADGSGDGIGDLTGIQYRLGYLRDLGVSAIRISPWHPSPMANGGYDVVDHRDIDPMFGDLADAEDFVADVHRHGLRVIMDLVPNHCSIEHRWFQEAVATGPDSAQRQRFWFRPGRGANGEQPPNDWASTFGRPAWTRITEPSGNDGEWYLHLFDVSQPDFNWNHPDVRAEFEEILRFWLDRGVDGFHVDAADRLCKNPLLPDLAGTTDCPYTDQQGVHEIFRSWRRIADSYQDERILLGDIEPSASERFTRYLRADELHAVTDTGLLYSPWQAEQLGRTINDTIDRHARIDVPPSWVLSGHNVTRQVTRYGRDERGFVVDRRRAGRIPVDRGVGTRRARAAALLAMALPGAVHIYQGDELGLWEVEDLPDLGSTGPLWRRRCGVDRDSDGARVPMPWQGEEPSFGFSPDDALGQPWLPQPLAWRELSAQAQLDDPQSMVALYRRALRIRHTELAGGAVDLAWLPAGPGTLAFARQHGFICVVNLSAPPLPLLPDHEILLASDEIDGTIPPDTAIWLRASEASDTAKEWPLAG